MQHLKRLPEKKGEDAVSPVVGVMLMIVIVIIISAIVSGFAGALVSSQQKTPSLSMNVKIINMGTWAGSGFFATVTGVSEPIPTSKLKIVTSWSTLRYGSGNVGLRQLPISCTTAVLPDGGGQSNILYLGNASNSLPPGLFVAPFGTGPGVNGTAETLGGVDTNLTSFSGAGQQFGNYTLVQGTTLTATPCGANGFNVIGGRGGNNGKAGYIGSSVGEDDWAYSDEMSSGCYYKTTCGSKYIDPITAVLGSKWETLKWGDTVNVKVIYLPTGAVIFNQNVPVTEG